MKQFIKKVRHWVRTGRWLSNTDIDTSLSRTDYLGPYTVAERFAPEPYTLGVDAYTGTVVAVKLNDGTLTYTLVGELHGDPVATALELQDRILAAVNSLWDLPEDPFDPKDWLGDSSFPARDEEAIALLKSDPDAYFKRFPRSEDEE